MDIQSEYLQEIVVHTNKHNVLRLHLSELSRRYRLYGEFYDAKQKEWCLVTFSPSRVGDCNALLEKCLKTFDTAMKKRKDAISKIENPCNAPYVSAEQQQHIVTGLGLTALVTVN